MYLNFNLLKAGFETAFLFSATALKTNNGLRPFDSRVKNYR